MFAPFRENNLVVPAQLLLSWGSTLPQTGGFRAHEHHALVGCSCSCGMVWLLWALDTAQVSRAHEQPAHLQGQRDCCIFTAGKGTEVPFLALDQEFRNDRLRAGSLWKSWKQIHAPACA